MDCVTGRGLISNILSGLWGWIGIISGLATLPAFFWWVFGALSGPWVLGLFATGIFGTWAHYSMRTKVDLTWRRSHTE